MKSIRKLTEDEKTDRVTDINLMWTNLLNA